MPRRARNAVGGIIYHVLNRGTGKMKLFGKAGDYQAFVEILGQAKERFPTMRILGYCIMDNHWHLVLLPAEDGQLSKFMSWVSTTHASRWRHARKLVGLGALYQGRFKSFAIESDEHLFTVLRYVERNPLRAKLVKRAEAYEWSSLSLRDNDAKLADELLSDWPIDRPGNWLDWVNRPQTDREEADVIRSMNTGFPFGDPSWKKKMSATLGVPLEPAPRGRPRLKK